MSCWGGIGRTGEKVVRWHIDLSRRMCVGGGHKVRADAMATGCYKCGRASGAESRIGGGSGPDGREILDTLKEVNSFSPDVNNKRSSHGKSMTRAKELSRAPSSNRPQSTPLGPGATKTYLVHVM
mmetsp:Transcript_8742/g.17861  ORF Transcript_8742/g.17861 Transcript_8742/m.17861 type:complete len:125 (+) Transcript_8742:249-623(+)